MRIDSMISSTHYTLKQGNHIYQINLRLCLSVRETWNKNICIFFCACFLFFMCWLSNMTHLVSAKCTICQFCMQLCQDHHPPATFQRGVTIFLSASFPHLPSSILSLPCVSARLPLCLSLGWMDCSSYSPPPRTL